MKKHWSIAIHLFFLAIISGQYFFRDFVFINANSQLKYLKGVKENEYAELYPNYTHSKMADFFGDWPMETIVSFKWYMTIAFTLLFGLLTFIGMKLTKNSKAANYTIAIYILCFISAYLISLFAYPVARQIVGFLHSPIPYLLLLIAGFIEIRIGNNHG